MAERTIDLQGTEESAGYLTPGFPLRRRLWVKVAISAISFLLYFSTFVWVYGIAGSGVLALSLIPVAITAGELGLSAGLVMPLLLFLVHMLLLFHPDLAPAEDFRADIFATSLASLLVGAVIGRFSDIYERL